MKIELPCGRQLDLDMSRMPCKAHAPQFAGVLQSAVFCLILSCFLASQNELKTAKFMILGLPKPEQRENGKRHSVFGLALLLLMKLSFAWPSFA